VTRPNPNDAHHRMTSEQRQRAEVSIVSEDNSPLAMGLLEQLVIAPPMPSPFSHVQDVEPSAAQMRHDVGMDVLVRKPSRVPQPHARCSASGITRSCFKTSAA